MQLTSPQIKGFQDTLFGYYAQSGRHDLPWRVSAKELDPYRIVVSELMLQQTQVSRVIPKYLAFLERFPSVQTLAGARLGDVLIAWQGLGYNRRAKFLWQTAQRVANELDGKFPDTLPGLVALPGIGKNTAGAILAYAFDTPSVFIETNIRTVYIHHFFTDEALVDDRNIAELIEQTMPSDAPREFYWALMDYGTHLKQAIGNVSTRSKHFVRQSPLEGSRRQVRGRVLKALAERGYSSSELAVVLPDQRLESVLADLGSEGLIERTDDTFHLA